jgi:hypothetical protein
VELLGNRINGHGNCAQLIGPCRSARRPEE